MRRVKMTNNFDDPNGYERESWASFDLAYQTSVSKKVDFSARLYGGDHEMRIMQEIVLGIGGVRVDGPSVQTIFARRIGSSDVITHLSCARSRHSL